MRFWHSRVIRSLALVLAWWQTEAAVLDERPLIFTGMCDASAAFWVSRETFAVASDEDNVLRFYRTDRPGRAVQTIDLRPLLSQKKKAPEADFEGAARIENRVFLITSHGRNAKGKAAPLRHRLVALDLSDNGGSTAVRLAGRAYTNLVGDLSRERRFDRFGLAEAAGQAPKAEGGLNIEALTDTPEGHLLIGFRNPVVENKALIIPLQNPNEVIMGQAPRFGEALLLDLGGLGLRGVGSRGQGYYLIAGPSGSQGQSRMFTWAGAGSPPQLVEGIKFAGINPEGICFHDMDGREEFLVLSDDGTRSINGAGCKALPEALRQFRAFRVTF